MANGKMSPLFLTKEGSDKNIEKVELDFSKVKKIKGTSNSYWVSQIHFHDANNVEIKRIASYQ